MYKFEWNALQLLQVSQLFPGCGGFFTDSNSGIITSPNFPSNYDNEQGCVYHIIMEEGKVGWLSRSKVQRYVSWLFNGQFQ